MLASIHVLPRSGADKAFWRRSPANAVIQLIPPVTVAIIALYTLAVRTELKVSMPTLNHVLTS